jgi:hypothetical protein
MTAYAAFGRVERGRVREPDPWEISPEAVIASVDLAALDDGAAPPVSLADGLAARLDRWRESWAMTTFYLFDPRSWR